MCKDSTCITYKTISLLEFFVAYVVMFSLGLQILHLKGDRQDFDSVKSSLSAEGFDVVYDINGGSR